MKGNIASSQPQPISHNKMQTCNQAVAEHKNILHYRPSSISSPSIYSSSQFFIIYYWPSQVFSVFIKKFDCQRRYDAVIIVVVVVAAVVVCASTWNSEHQRNSLSLSLLTYQLLVNSELIVSWSFVDNSGADQLVLICSCQFSSCWLQGGIFLNCKVTNFVMMQAEFWE